MVFVIRSDLKMGKGKVAAQVSVDHTLGESFYDSPLILSKLVPAYLFVHCWIQDVWDHNLTCFYFKNFFLYIPKCGHAAIGAYMQVRRVNPEVYNYKHLCFPD